MIKSPLIQIGIVSGIIALDQLCKLIAQLHLHFLDPTPLIPKLLAFQLVYNYGAAYGILAYQRPLLIGISIVVLIASVVFYRHLVTSRWSQFGLLCIQAGTIGNLWDRVFRGYVVDFINIHIIPVFNIADMAINIGVLLFIIEFFMALKSKKSADIG